MVELLALHNYSLRYINHKYSFFQPHNFFEQNPTLIECFSWFLGQKGKFGNDFPYQKTLFGFVAIIVVLVFLIDFSPSLHLFWLVLPAI